MLHNGYVYRQGTLGKFEYIMMTSSNGSIFRATGSTSLAFVRGIHRGLPAQRPVTQSIDGFFD